MSLFQSNCVRSPMDSQGNGSRSRPLNCHQSHALRSCRCWKALCRSTVPRWLRTTRWRRPARFCASMVGTLSLCPPYALRTDLLYAQAQSRCATAATRHDRQITSDFQKSCQARESKIFRFRSHPNQSHNSFRLTADEGRWPSSRTRGEMRWTRELRLTCAA